MSAMAQTSDTVETTESRSDPEVTKVEEPAAYVISILADSSSIGKGRNVGRPKAKLITELEDLKTMLCKAVKETFLQLEPESKLIVRSDTLATAVIRIVFRIPYRLASDRRIIP